MSAAMGGGMAASAVGSYYTAQLQGAAIEGQADYQTQVAGQNAKLSEMAADDSVKRGEYNANKVTSQVERVIGSQRVAGAANGVNVNTGTIKDIQTGTMVEGVNAASQVRLNAWREAFGHKIEAANQIANAEMNQLAAKNSKKLTLLTGGINAISSGGQAAYYMGKDGSGGGATKTKG